MHVLFSLLTLMFTSAAADLNHKTKFDWSCESALAPVAKGARELFAGFITLPSGTELFTRIEAPVDGGPKGWVLAVHGLLDSHRAYDALTADLIARGYGVVRPDLRGFARSLHHRHPLTGRLDYQDSVRDLKELITLLRLRHHILRPQLVGHSMGGALVVALLADGGVTEYVAEHHVISNPYVYRAEYYAANKMNMSTLTMMAPFIPSSLKILPQIMADSVLDPQMRHVFSTYLRTARQTQGLNLNEFRVRQALDEQVEVAIQVVKGLRNLNSLDEIKRVPAPLRIDMIYGDRDEVVEPPHARELARKIVARGGRAVEIRADHHIPTNNAGDLGRLITE